MWVGKESGRVGVPREGGGRSKHEVSTTPGPSKSDPVGLSDRVIVSLGTRVDFTSVTNGLSTPTQA